MRVLWISHSANASGGAERSLIETIAALKQRGVWSIVAVPRSGPIVPLLEAAGAGVYVVSYHRWAGQRGVRPQLGRLRIFKDAVVAARRIAAITREQDVDLVVTNTLAVPVGAIAARVAGVPHVWFVREFARGNADLHLALGWRITHLCIRALSETVVVTSQALWRELSSQGRHPVRRVRYAVDAPVLPPTSSAGKPLSVLVPGRMRPSKGQEDALRAARILEDRGLEMHFTFVGTDRSPYGVRLRAVAAELGLDRRVTFAGPQQSIYSFLGSTDVVVVCSRSEGFGRVAAEALIGGKPVVGANSTATAEMIRDTWNGYLYKAGDAEDLAAKLAALNDDRGRLEQMGVNARVYADQHLSMDAYVSDLLDVFTNARYGRRET